MFSRGKWPARGGLSFSLFGIEVQEVRNVVRAIPGGWLLAAGLPLLLGTAPAANSSSDSATALAESVIRSQICSTTKKLARDRHHNYALIGKPGRAGKVSRVIRISMDDTMRFTPESLQVRQGETIRFVVGNIGRFRHEMVLGTDRQLKEHNEEMKSAPEMTHVDPNMVVLEPGRHGQIIWQFTQSGRVDFACLQPGHYDSGMKGHVQIVSAPGR